MKKLVVFLLVFAFLLNIGALYTSWGDFRGIKNTFIKAIDFIMFIPSQATVLFESIFHTSLNSPSEIDSNIKCDFYVRYVVDGEVYILYLDIVSFRDGADTVFEYFFGGSNDEWWCRVVANSYDNLWVGRDFLFYAGGCSWFKKTYHKLLDKVVLPTIDGSGIVSYTIDASHVVLPYDEYSDSSHGGR